MSADCVIKTLIHYLISSITGSLIWCFCFFSMSSHWGTLNRFYERRKITFDSSRARHRDDTSHIPIADHYSFHLFIHGILQDCSHGVGINQRVEFCPRCSVSMVRNGPKHSLQLGPCFPHLSFVLPSSVMPSGGAIHPRLPDPRSTAFCRKEITTVQERRWKSCLVTWR